MKPLRAALNLGEKNENLSTGADVLHNTSTLVISRCSFADDGKEMDKNEKRTCRACKAIVFAHQICKFVTFSLPSPLSLLKLPTREFKKRRRLRHRQRHKAKGKERNFI